MFIADFEMTEAARGSRPTDLPHEGWIPAAAPGGVHETLLAAGRITSPYYARDEADIRWIEDRDWWFRTTFTVPDGPWERARLVFDGLDTVVDLWLDGEPLGHHENMFRPAIFEVTAGEHQVLLRFGPPLGGLSVPPPVKLFGQRLATALLGEQAGDTDQSLLPLPPVATLRRKAAFSWGWDFGPRVPSIGIWCPVRLELDGPARISAHHVRTRALNPDGSAGVDVLVEVERLSAQDRLTARVSLTSPRGHHTTTTVPVEDRTGRAQVTVEHADLWWTHDLGEPTLYDVDIELYAGEQGLDRVRDRTGLRTIRLDRDPDPEGGRRFQFVLNDVPVFARGANWLPPDMLVGSIRPERYRALVDLARSAQMSMLRVWGGGVYGSDDFYRACDEAGIMIWQDFMFACSDYPGEDLAEEVDAEARYQIRRLRNHPSLALWSGNNEVQLLHSYAFHDDGPGPWGYDIFHRLLPALVEELDGATPYWFSSPWGEDPSEGFLAANGVRDGDRHAWEVWHGVDAGLGDGPYESVDHARFYRRYEHDTGKFISEFGLHAAPPLRTLRSWLPEDERYVHSPSFDHHNKENPKDKHDALMAMSVGRPADLGQYVDFSMASQAEGLKFGVEHYRRRQPHCGGTLVWQFNDVWPGISWSVVDHDLNPKAAYYYLARAFAPVIATFRQVRGTVELWVTNSGRLSVTGTATVTLAGFDGSVRLCRPVDVKLEPGDSQAVWTHEGPPPTADSYAWAESPLFPANRLFFAEVKDIPFPDSTLTVTREHIAPDRARLVLSASGYVYFAHVLTPTPGIGLSQNYLDLRDGDEATVEVTGLPHGFDLNALSVRHFRGPS